MASREVLPGHWLQTYAAPSVAGAGPRAGQYVQVRTGEPSRLVMRHAFGIAALDRAAGRVTIEIGAETPGGIRLTAARVGARATMTGPFGRPFEVHPRSRHLLLVGDGPALAVLRALADEALAQGRQVTLVAGARRAAEVYPSSLLPAEVEYVVATDDGSLGHAGPVTDLVPAYEAWADQAFACGPLPVLATLTGLAAGRTARLGVARLGRRGRPRSTVAPGSAAARRRSWLQVALVPPLTCASGTCLGCVVEGVGGPQRACREGPVFAADELAWPGHDR